MYKRDMFLILIYIIFFICSVIFSLLINRLFLKYAKTLGTRNGNERTVRWSAEPKPAFGGIAFYILFLLSIVAYSLIFFEHNHYFLNKQFFGILFAITFYFTMGLFDDTYNIKPFIKLLIQICCGIILIYTGTFIHLFSNNLINHALTLFWVVGIMNSINMLDNMDAISPIISACILITVIVILLLFHNISTPILFILIGVLGGILGFLYYNWYPSKIFMGNTGSQFLGVFLATIGIIYLWNGKDISVTEIPEKQILSAILVFLVTLIDTTTVIIKRIVAGRTPFIGGKDHTTHHLFYIGLNERQVAFVFLAISLVSSALAILILTIPVWKHIYTILFSIYVLSVFAILFYIANLNKK